MKKNILFSLIILALSSCHNQDWSFPDFDYSTVYFAYQYPVRTLTMGEDPMVNTDLDNEHKCKIMATWGGGYTNKNNVIIDLKVDESLCNNLLFKDNNEEIIAMPSNYYELASDQIIIPKGEIYGGVEVKLTDAFFADPLAVQRTYVIPLVMTHVQNADSILQGMAAAVDANRCDADAWSVVPKDYILYAVKYKNEWDASYLRRGTDIVTANGNTPFTNVRHQKYVENDEVSKINTISLSEAELPIIYENEEGTHMPLSIAMTFKDNSCTIKEKATSIEVNDSVRIYNIAAQGNGKFIKKGEKNSWGNEDRDVLHLDYTVSFDVEIEFPTSKLATRRDKLEYATKDTLVVQSRGVAKLDLYEVVLK